MATPPGTIRILTVDEEAAWQAAVPAYSSVFGSLVYARIVQAQTGAAARLFLWEQGGVQVAYPLFLRPVADLPFAPPAAAALWDTTTPEFTGPRAPAGADAGALAGFRAGFAAWCRAEGIVAEFAHLYPWQEPGGLLDAAAVEFNREIVYFDLTVPDAQLRRAHFSHACRKNLNRAQQEGVETFAAATPEHLAAFHRIYTLTMERTGAHARYYFPLAYFQALFEQLGERALFLLAQVGGQIVAGTLYLNDATDMYSYLGGADHRFAQARPTNAVVYAAICWGRAMGRQRLVLGGGYQPDDGIFRFKAGFSPLRARFHIYKQIHQPAVYNALCAAWAAYYHQTPEPAGPFPAYRATAH
jgi:serine/alanine adding enzyme